MPKPRKHQVSLDAKTHVREALGERELGADRLQRTVSTMPPRFGASPPRDEPRERRRDGSCSGSSASGEDELSAVERHSSFCTTFSGDYCIETDIGATGSYTMIRNLAVLPPRRPVGHAAASIAP